MHAGEQQGLDDGPLPGRVDVTRGVVVIVLAVLIGGFLLYRGVDDGPQEVAADEVSGSTLSAEGEVVDETAGPATGSTRSTAGADSTTDVTDDADGAPVTGATAANGEPADGEDSSGTSAVTATTAAPTTSEASTGTSSATAATADGPAGVTVLVLNAASEKGVAGKGTEILDDAGYDVMAPKNADALGPSRVLFTAGNESLAEEVATVLGADTGLVRALDPSAPPIREYGAADVIVVIGTDGAIDVSGG